MDPLRKLRRTAFRRGIRGNSHPWLTVWVTLASAHLVRKLVTAKPAVEQFELRPGETILIRDLGALSDSARSEPS